MGGDNPVLNEGTYELDGGKRLHFWSRDGNYWTCMAYDHGPMCRLCQPVDGTMNALLQNVVDGLMIVKQGPGGEFLFKVTPQGEAQVKRMIERNAKDDK